MATTLLALRVENLELRWVSVGDSPLLLSRNGGLLRLNADHSGRAEDYQSTLARNELASALTGGRIRLVDLPGEPYPLERGDLILAASDGLWTLTLSEISSLLHAHAESHTSEIASRLLTEIERKGKSSQDNATIAIIRIA
jgi:serine/threonine protein phosphatase PrpC